MGRSARTGSSARAARGAIIIGGLWPALAFGLPEGTPQLGLTQGLDANTAVRVEVVEAGETLRVCSSDDGLQDPDVAPGEAGRIDQVPGADNPVAEGRQGAEIIVYRPDAPACDGFEDCDLDLPELCYVQPYGVSISAFREQNGREPMGSERARCGQLLEVRPGGVGACTAGSVDPQHHALVADVPGTWTLDFAGEPETRTASGTSTRYFEVEVLRPDGSPVDGGRVNAPFWGLNAHSFEYATDADFYAVAPIGGGARVFVIDFEALRGFRYTVVANDDGLVEHPDQSWCEFGDPDGDGICPDQGAGPRQVFFSQYAIYLNWPDPPVEPPAAPALVDVVFEDADGTPSISPDGDGVQDAGTFRFTPNLAGVWRIIVDTDGDGAFDPTRDHVVRGRVERPGEVIEVPFDGMAPDGMPYPDGEYAVRFELSVGETHFPMADIEDNAAGFVMWEQTGPAPADRVPLPMYWDDTPVVPGVDEQPDGYRITGWPDGSSVPPDGPHERRAWVQPGFPADDRPLVFDTWVSGAQALVGEFGCRRCEAPRATLIIGPRNESGDRDGDGLPDDVEDANGNGVVDPGETDPDNPDTDGDGLTDGQEVNADNPTDPTRADTDGDGLPDGVEDADGDGAVGEGETDPTRADTDGDGLFDGAEDANGNGRVDAGESDPLDADTDDDGVLDGEDPRPTIPDAPPPDAGPDDAGAGPDATLVDGRVPDPRADVSVGGADFGPNTDLDGVGDDGCGCSAADRDPPGPGALIGLLLILGFGRARRRRP